MTERLRTPAPQLQGPPQGAADVTYHRLMSMLARSSAQYRIIDHPPEGRTDLASELRGHRLESAAKCMVVQVRMSHGEDHHVLAVVPGHRRVDLRRIRKLYGGSDATLGDRDEAERLTGCRSGCIIPFSFDEALPLVVDADLLTNEEIYFNAARLDRSIALRTTDYVTLGRPRVATVAK
ncbi:YbaK/EbsC family protein [Streptomyces sp. NBC_01591]|uniref:YbaK/EbsC family protein n=1 Tax=Streptomyces sp. NBC_01591 TaxID=2975888 RepID=UPI002DD7BE8D|nr:YbaK/EbsC family protein [Streptomyces sp. NBC_01591]